MTEICDDAHRAARLAARLSAILPKADEWLLARTPDGYPSSASGAAPIGSSSDPSASPTLSAIASQRTIALPEGQADYRSAHNLLAVHIARALSSLDAALSIIDAIPRAPEGPAAARIAYELKHSRCEGWGEQYAICDDLSVTSTSLDGSHIPLCQRCYSAMWKQTRPAGNTRTRIDPEEHARAERGSAATVRETGHTGRPSSEKAPR